MAQEPDRIRAEIDRTRAELTRDVDRLAEKTSPAKVAQRRWTAVKEKVMGSADHGRHVASDKTSSAVGTVQDTASRVGDKASNTASRVGEKASDAASTASDAVRSAPGAVARQTEGNPIAAGVIAFGIGMLAATLIPATDAEKRAGLQLKEHSGDLTDKVKETAQEMKEDLGGTVKQAAAEVKDTAQDAAQSTAQQAKSSARGAADETKQAARNS